MAGSSIWAPVGEQGPPGPEGPPGPPGPIGPRPLAILPPSATNPTTRVDGSPLELGDMYLNTTTNSNWVYGNDGWFDTASSSDRLLATNFGVVGDGVTDDSAAIVAALDAAWAQKRELIFPSGKTYAHVQPINAFRGDNFRVRCEGFSTFKYTGTTVGPSFSLDGGATGSKYGVVFTGFNIQGNANSTIAFDTRAFSHSTIDVRAWNCTDAAMRIRSGVENTYNLRLTSSGGVPGEPNIRPKECIILDSRTPGDYVAWCKFNSLIAEFSTELNVHLIDATGNLFSAGTFEHGDGAGLLIEEICRNNTFINTDYETNGAGGDIIVNGHNNQFINNQLISFATSKNISVRNAQGTVFIGGYLRAAELQAASKGTLFFGCEFSDNGALGIQAAAGATYRAIACRKTNALDQITSFVPEYPIVSWTPTIPGAATYSIQKGTAVLVDKQVTFQGYLALTSKGGGIATPIKIDGLPYVSSAAANSFSAIVIGQYGGITFPAGRTQFAGYVGANTTQITLSTNGSNVGAATVASTDITDTFFIIFSGSYQIP